MPLRTELDCIDRNSQNRPYQAETSFESGRNSSKKIIINYAKLTVLNFEATLNKKTLIPLNFEVHHLSRYLTLHLPSLTP